MSQVKAHCILLLLLSPVAMHVKWQCARDTKETSEAIRWHSFPLQVSKLKLKEPGGSSTRP